MKKLALWKDHLQNVYDNFEEWKNYSGMYGLCKRLGYKNEEEAWEANPLIQGSEQPEDFKVVKSQAEEPIVEEPTEKEFEMEFMSDYDDIKFAITWKDQIPTDEEMEVVKKHFINEGYEEENFNIMVFGDFLDQLYDQIESDGGTLSDYVDEASMIHDRILNGELDLIKTSTGYVAIELYH